MEKQERIEKLQQKLDEIKRREEIKQQTRGLEIKPVGKLPGLGGQFEEVGKTIREARESIPKIKLGKDKPNKNYIEDPFVTKMKRWLLIGLTVLIGGGAAVLVVLAIIRRFI